MLWDGHRLPRRPPGARRKGQRHREPACCSRASPCRTPCSRGRASSSRRDHEGGQRPPRRRGRWARLPGAWARPRAPGRPRRVPREWPDRKHRTPGSHGRVAFSSPACGRRPFPAEGPAHLRGRSATSGQSHSHAFPPAPPLAPEIKPGFSAAAAPSFTPATSPVATQDTATRPRRPVRRLPRSAHRGSPAPACPAGGNAAGSLDDDGGSREAAADAPAAAPGWALLGPTVAPDGQEPQGTHRPRRPSPACPAAGARGFRPEGRRPCLARACVWLCRGRCWFCRPLVAGPLVHLAKEA